MRPIPFLRLRNDGQMNRRGMAFSDLLKTPNIDFADPLQLAFWRFFEVHTKHIPVIRERDNRQPTNRNVPPFEKAGSDTRPVAFVGADSADDVLFRSEGHRSLNGQTAGQFFSSAVWN